MKICIKCLLEKDETQISSLRRVCKLCLAEARRIRDQRPDIASKNKAKRNTDEYRKASAERQESYRKRHPDRIKAKKLSEEGKLSRKKTILLNQYGITLEERNAMLTKQDGKCANLACLENITGNDKLNRSLAHLDHNHKTGKVRGLLCGPCNRAAGMLRDSPERAIGLSDYLKSNQ